MKLYQRTLDSDLGTLRVVSNDTHLVAVLWPEQPFTQPLEKGEPKVLLSTLKQLERYLTASKQDFNLPLEPRGTDFETQVWRSLMAIPFGETRSYSALAAALGKPTAVRAVAAAIGRNPWSIVVPCHRVIAKNGALTGFAGGLERKAWLLRHEHAIS